MFFLDFYIPIIILLNSKGHKCTLFYTKGKKKSFTDMSDPLISIGELINYSKKFNFTISNFDKFNYKCDIIFIFSNNMLNFINKIQHIKIIRIMPYFNIGSTENNFDRNIMEKIDKNIFFSNKELIHQLYRFFLNTHKDQERMNNCAKIFFEYTNKHRFLNLNVKFNRNSIIEKYNLDKKDKFIMIFLPNIITEKDESLYDIKKYNYIYNYFKDYFFILKTRNKDDYPEKIKQDFPKNSIYVNDTEWYPYPSLELIFISELVICSSNTSVIFESINLNKKTLILKTDKNYPFEDWVYFFDKYSHLCQHIKEIEDINKIDLKSISPPLENINIENNDILELIT